MRPKSGEAIVGTIEGVLKARDFRRKPESGGRWDRAKFDKFVGVPWELYPGIKGSTEMKSKVRLPQEPSEVTRPVRGKDEYVPRRFRIQKGDLEKFGYTAGCLGCRAANRGLPATGHSEECRRGIQEGLEQAGDARIERETARANAYFGELLEESDKQRLKKPGDEEGEPEQHRGGEGRERHRREEHGEHHGEAQPEKEARRDDEGGSRPDNANTRVPKMQKHGTQKCKHTGPKNENTRDDTGGSSSSGGPSRGATVPSESMQDDMNEEIKGQKRGEEDSWEAFAKRL